VLDGGQLSVYRSLVSVGYALHETRGKTRSPRRRIDLDRPTIEVIETWLVLRREKSPTLGPGPDDYLFESRSRSSPSGATTQTPGFTMATYQHALPGVQAERR
jgi:integrase